MRRRARTILLACTVAATVAASALVNEGSPLAQAQSGPSDSTGDTGGTSCPSDNAPNELVLVNGTPQTAELDTGFAGPLQVELANSNGCSITANITGTAITFTAPANGPSATFAASGSNTLTVGSDAADSASVQMLTADNTAGSYAVTASSAYGSVSFWLTNAAAGIPAMITPLAPTSQHATVSSRYSQPLAVRVRDANGNPVVAANVTFSLGSAAATETGGGGAAGASFDNGASEATETTSADGVATSPGFSANATHGTFTASASVAHVTEPARFALDNHAAKPHAITPFGSSSPTATIGTRYADRLRVKVRTASGMPVADVTVTFTLGSGSATGASAAGGGPGASFTGGSTQATATTGAHGIAISPRLIANDHAGRFTATATASATRGIALFHLHNHAGVPSTLTPGVGVAQSATTATRFAIPLAVTVTDAHGNKVPGARVTFTAPSSGAGGSFASGRTTVTLTTNASGIAVAPAFAANSQAGGYVVTATVHGLRPVAFALVNTAS
jgi:hypothetical protein